MRLKPFLGENERKILLYLAENGPQNKYELSMKTGINRYATIQQVTKYLESIGILDGKDIGTARTGLIKKAWHLSSNGFCLAIEFLKEDKEQITEARFEKIIQSWQHLQPLFRRWPLLKQTMGWKAACSFLYFCSAAFNEEPKREPESLYESIESYRFTEKTIYAYLDHITEILVRRECNTRMLTERRVYDTLMQDAKNFGLDDDLSNIKTVARSLIKKCKTTACIEKGSSNIAIDNDVTISFIILLEDLKEAADFNKWITLLLKLEDFQAPYELYTMEAESKAEDAQYVAKVLKGLLPKKTG